MLCEIMAGLYDAVMEDIVIKSELSSDIYIYIYTSD